MPQRVLRIGATVPCSTGCPTPGAHKSFGECLRNKGIQIADVDARVVNNTVYRDQNEYAEARAEGMQPDGIGGQHVAFARKVTELTGTPYRGDADDVSYLAERVKK